MAGSKVPRTGETKAGRKAVPTVETIAVPTAETRVGSKVVLTAETMAVSTAG